MAIGSSLSVQSQHISRERFKNQIKIAIKIKKKKKKKHNQKHLWLYFITEKAIALTCLECCSSFYCQRFSALCLCLHIMFSCYVCFVLIVCLIFIYNISSFYYFVLWLSHRLSVKSSFCSSRLCDNCWWWAADAFNWISSNNRMHAHILPKYVRKSQTTIGRFSIYERLSNVDDWPAARRSYRN